MPEVERPPVLLDSKDSIDAVYSYYRNLQADPVVAHRVYRALGTAFHPRVYWEDGAQDQVAQLTEDGGVKAWAPNHTSNLDPLYQAAAIYHEPELHDMIANVSILTKPDWYNIKGIGSFIHWLYDNAVAVPVSRLSHLPDLMQYANDQSVETIAQRAIEFGEDYSAYVGGKRNKEDHTKIPEKMHPGLFRIARIIGATGIKVQVMPTAIWNGQSKFVRRTAGLRSPIMYIGRLFDPTGDHKADLERLRKEQQRLLDKAIYIGSSDERKVTD